jgi:hypothetical protein
VRIHSGFHEAIEGRALIYAHKEREWADVEEQYPAEHYVLIDDKFRILDAIKKIWGVRVPTVFVQQGHYARDPKILASYAPTDVSMRRIGDFLSWQLQEFEAKPRPT